MYKHTTDKGNSQILILVREGAPKLRVGSIQYID